MTRLRTMALLLGFAVAPAQAHDMNLARYSLSMAAAAADGSRIVTIELVIPLQVAGPGELQWPAACAAQTRTRMDAGSSSRLSFSARCAGTPSPADFARSPWGADGAVLTTLGPAGSSSTRMLIGSGDGVRIPLTPVDAQSRRLVNVAGEYVGLGVTHILEGWDHLAFVLCLFLLARGRLLIWLVTAFTIGHSLSLAMAFLDLVRIPVPPTEAMIALSVVFMAREALQGEHRGSGRGCHSRYESREAYRWERAVVVVVVFGLLHGLGFASVLGELGVATGERIAGLLSFNVGVEIGQLLFVAVLAALDRIARSLRIETHLRLAALGGAGVLGAFWFVERIVGFTGF